MKLQGKIFNWNDERGFGFAEPLGGGDHVFVHINSFKSRSLRPVNGDVIFLKCFVKMIIAIKLQMLNSCAI